MSLMDKKTIRERAGKARRNQSDASVLSDKIGCQLMSLPLYQSCRSVMWYVSVRDEVDTRNAIQTLLQQETQVISVPYCDGDDLVAVELRDWDDLQPGKFGILEPRAELRRDESREVHADALDAVIVPGIAFDLQGGRVGHGAGYYDRFLARTRAKCCRIALAFDVQVFDEVPTEDHDIKMNWLVTQTASRICR